MLASDATALSVFAHLAPHGRTTGARARAAEHAARTHGRAARRFPSDRTEHPPRGSSLQTPSLLLPAPPKIPGTPWACAVGVDRAAEIPMEEMPRQRRQRHRGGAGASLNAGFPDLTTEQGHYPTDCALILTPLSKEPADGRRCLGDRGLRGNGHACRHGALAWTVSGQRRGRRPTRRKRRCDDHTKTKRRRLGIMPQG